MNIDDKTRKKVLKTLKKYIIEPTSQDKKVIELFEEPVALNVRIDIKNHKLATADFPTLTIKHFKALIRKGKLYFDFTDNWEEDKKFYEDNGEKWDESYSYNKVGDIETDYESNFGESAGDMFFVLNDDEGYVDYCRFDIRKIEYVDETHFDVIDEGCHKGDKRRFAIL